MKLRIKGNSVRLRMTRLEVAQLANTGLVEELTNFGSGYLTYAIKTAEQDQLSANFTESRITIFMPQEFAAAWAGNDIVGLQQDGTGLHILVEKDFKCIDRMEEDQSDQFDHPSTKHHG